MSDAQQPEKSDAGWPAASAVELPAGSGVELPAIVAIKAAVGGLLYPSESDEPFDVFHWPATAGDASVQVAARAGKRKVEEFTLDMFLAQLEGSDDIERFRKLGSILESFLTGVRAVRAGVGETRVDVYLIGKLPDGSWTGAHTVSVET